MPANEYYDSSGAPSTSSTGSSATMRGEFDSVETGFNKLPTLAANADKAIFVNASANGLTAVTAATARINIGVVIGTNVQAWDTQLDSLAGLAYTSNALKVIRVNAGATAFELSIAAAGDLVAANNLSDVASAATALSNIGGIGSATTNTLTNKTINLTSNTLAGTTAQFNTAISDGDFATLAGAETLTNKTVNLTSNTLTGTTAQFNTALSDGDFATLAGTETLSNKTLDESNRTVGSPINAQTGTTYTFVLTDSGKLCTFSNASAITVTVPPNSSVAFPVGSQIDCSQVGAGKTTLAQGSGVTINSKSSNKAIGAQYVGVTLRKTATDTWLLVGELIA